MFKRWLIVLSGLLGALMLTLLFVWELPHGWAREAVLETALAVALVGLASLAVRFVRKG